MFNEKVGLEFAYELIKETKKQQKKLSLDVNLREDLFKSFYNYDVNIIGIPIGISFNKIKKIVDMCDGIVLSGGDNFTKNDFLLVEYLYQKNIPTLGICLGMQSMAKYFSNQEEINIENHSTTNKYVHYINIDKNSLLYKILSNEKILVNSRHNSAIVDTKIFVSARSDDGVIEAVEDNNKKFFVGVEWHPESLDDENTKKLFEYFVNKL